MSQRICRCSVLLRLSSLCVLAGLLRPESKGALPPGSPLASAQRVVILGDSITYAGGYVDNFVVALRLAEPQLRVEILDLGLAAETVAGLTEAGFANGEFPRPDLHERLQRILELAHPDLVIACYGMNDGLYAPPSPLRQRKYQEGMEFLHHLVEASGARIIHVTPPIFDPLPVRAHALPLGAPKYAFETPYVDYDEVLAQDSAWLLAHRRQGWQVVDVHAAMHAYLMEQRRSRPNFTFSKDGVHPNAEGHAVMARALLDFFGVPDGLSGDWSDVLRLEHERMEVLRDAWLTYTRNTRPRMPVGLPIPQAEARARELEPAIDQAIAARSAPAPAKVSLYLPVRDGTRLAIDLYRPAAPAGPGQRWPVVLRATPYHRDLAPAGHLGGLARALLEHGYAVASLDLRGHGASFGSIYGGGFDGAQARLDLYDVIEWLAAQPWCSGRIGMIGASYEGVSQFWAATAMPPHLRALVLSAAPLDWYASYRVNGVLQLKASQGWDDVIRAMDLDHVGARVDEDTDGSLLAAAVREHRSTWQTGQAPATPLRRLPFRDSPAPVGLRGYESANWWNYVSNLKITQVPVLQFAGWRDKFVDQSFALYRTLAEYGVPQRLIVGPWYHGAWSHGPLSDAVAIQLRWFDHWLREPAAPLDDGAPVRYYVTGAGPARPWQGSEGWPPRGLVRAEYFLGDDGSGRGGGLTARPSGRDGAEECPAAAEFTSAQILTRWNYVDNGPADVERGLLPVAMDRLNRLGLCYTTVAFPADRQFTGFPVLSLWLRTTGPTDLFAFLEEVDETGHATLLCDGAVRVADAAPAHAPFANESLPWHSGLSSAHRDDTHGFTAIRVEVALYPLSNVLPSGHRLRLMLSGFDGAWGDSPPPTAGTQIFVLHDPSHPSTLSMPLVHL